MIDKAGMREDECHPTQAMALFDCEFAAAGVDAPAQIREPIIHDDDVSMTLFVFFLTSEKH